MYDMKKIACTFECTLKMDHEAEGANIPIKKEESILMLLSIVRSLKLHCNLNSLFETI